MELHPDIEWLIAYLYCLDKPAVRRYAAQRKTCICEPFTVVIVEFITMAVTLTYSDYTIAGCDLCTFTENTWICSQPECSALVYVFALAGNKMYDLICALLVELA